MSETDTFEHIRKVREMLPDMLKYNDRITEAFEEFLDCQTPDKIIKVCELKQGPAARSSYNTYKHIRMLHWITDIAAREMSAGCIPITEGIHSLKDAIDRYRIITYMLRRNVLLDEVVDGICIDEAVEYIRSENISAVAIHDIIENDVCFGDRSKAISYWMGILQSIGREKDALFLGRMP